MESEDVWLYWLCLGVYIKTYPKLEDSTISQRNLERIRCIKRRWNITDVAWF